MNKIDLKQPNQAENARINRTPDAIRANQAEKLQPPTGSAESDQDKISVSERATTIENLTARVNQLPDMRQEKVEAMRERIQSGSYNPSANDIADAILKDEK